MKIGDRDPTAGIILREDCQVLVATEAAGEGINLQVFLQSLSQLRP
jgi:hypothetical protein